MIYELFFDQRNIGKIFNEELIYIMGYFTMKLKHLQD